MQTNLKVQKIITIIYTIVLLLGAIYCLGFMTEYKHLDNFKTLPNRGITDCFNAFQKFNKVIIYVSLISLIGLIVNRVMEVKQKICDITALVCCGLFSLLAIFYSLFTLIKLGGLKEIYLNTDFTKMHLEDVVLPDNYVYQHLFTAFDFGYVVSVIVLLVSTLFLGVLIYNHIKYIKTYGGQKNEC